MTVEKRERGKKEKKKRKISGMKSPPKKEVRVIFFLFAVVIFGSIRNTLFRVKQTIPTFILMQDIIDEQIR